MENLERIKRLDALRGQAVAFHRNLPGEYFQRSNLQIYYGAAVTEALNLQVSP
jgi:hypothetical protein